jgi:L-fucose dehydrogenase
MNLNLEGKVALVTGGAKGIGAAIVRSFAEEGAVVSIVDRNPEVARVLVNELEQSNNKAFSVPTELTDLNACKQAIEDTIRKAGRLDFLIHNAGSNDGVGLDAQPDKFMESLNKNLSHIFALTHYSIDELIKNRGAIINIGSKVAETIDLADKGVRVNSVIPAEVMTPMYRRWLDSLKKPEETLHSIEQNIPLGNRMTMDHEIADAVVFLASDRSAHTTGQIFHPDGGYVHLDRSFGKVKLD